MWTIRIALATTLSLLAVPALADEVIFLNGDRLTGKVVSATGGKLVFKTEAAGEITIDMSKVKTFSTDDPHVVKLGEKTQVTTKVGAGPDGQVQAQITPDAAAQPVPIKDITAIDPPAPAWHGSIALNGLLTTGNTETEQLGFTAALSKRWETERLTFGASYTYGRQEDPDTSEKTTTVDYGEVLAKFDHFFTKKFYGYALVKAQHDGVAELEIRLSPGVGVGYQWFEGPTFNFATEAGLTYVYEKYEHQDATDFLGPRLAYAIDWSPVPVLKLYHTLEYIPSFEDFGGDYLLNLTAGAKVKITKGFFADFRLEWLYDSTPASGREKVDTRYILAVGWEF